MTRYVFAAALLCGWGLPALAQPTVPTEEQKRSPGPAPADTFDLVLVGDRLSADAHQAALAPNPGQPRTWTPLDGAQCRGTPHLLVVPGLPTARYLGQDIRENYLALRITTQDRADGGLRAAYAVPHVGPFDAAACRRLLRLVRTEPQMVRRHSWAAYERPRPAPLRPGTPFLDHVEAPVRHRKPGVVEVEWLNVLFSNGE